MSKKGLTLLILVVTAGILLISPASAQESPEIESLEVALWPEFDRAEVLVIYRVQLAPGSDLPAQVNLPIPAEVGEPFAAAFKGEGGQLMIAPYERTVEGEWAIISLQTESLGVQLEYYMDLPTEEPNRSFVFNWPKNFPVGLLRYEIQEPVGASAFEISPLPDQTSDGDDGLTYHWADMGQVSAEMGAKITVNYFKADDLLSADTLATPAPVTLSRPQTTQGGTPDMAQILPWVLGGLGLVLLVGGGLMYRRYAQETSRVRRRPRKPRRADKEAPGEIEASPVFCHKCGSRASVSDRYCRNCGVRLRH
jgi:hypothetical protein